MSFQTHANIALLKYVLTARDRGIDYAPDNGGPHTVVIGRMLYGQAQAWARDMVEAHADNVRVDGKAAWFEAMRLVDERIRGYIASNNLAKRAA